MARILLKISAQAESTMLGSSWILTDKKTPSATDWATPVWHFRAARREPPAELLRTAARRCNLLFDLRLRLVGFCVLIFKSFAGSFIRRRRRNIGGDRRGVRRLR